jgi:hypothetical protein
MQVSINGELFAECDGVMPERWNGWAVPIFSGAQMAFVISECERLGYYESSDDVREGWEDLGNGEWTTSGWVWEVVGE